MVDKRFFYNAISEDFDDLMNKYDLNKRLDIVFSHLIGNNNIEGKLLLDAGCGTGWFSLRAMELGARVTSLDIGIRLLQKARQKCTMNPVVGDVMLLPFPDNSFDVVVCSEVIEHTISPSTSVGELCRVTRQEGVLVLTVPNRFWCPAILLANCLKLRPYEGFEHWVSVGNLRQWLDRHNFRIEVMLGFNIVPFFSPKLYGLIDFFDRWSTRLYPIMLNIGVSARKIK